MQQSCVRTMSHDPLSRPRATARRTQPASPPCPALLRPPAAAPAAFGRAAWRAPGRGPAPWRGRQRCLATNATLHPGSPTPAHCFPVTLSWGAGPEGPRGWRRRGGGRRRGGRGRGGGARRVGAPQSRIAGAQKLHRLPCPHAQCVATRASQRCQHPNPGNAVRFAASMAEWRTRLRPVQ
ncbi:MAG: hypothetical protein J3K34DRAFT_6058 [Monoraphidium minutum]|nr:MAG: hypothetical protein J3K34DRAFT_6058 [Monoraphidium minutum]